MTFCALMQKRERFTQRRSTITGRPLTPTKYPSEEESQKPWKNAHRYEIRTCQVYYATRWNLKDGSVSYSEAFYPDYPTLIDRYPEYDTDKTPW
jgi:hypothetical protein